MSGVLTEFFRRWPRLAVFGTLLAATSAGFLAAAGVRALLGDDPVALLAIAFILVWVAGLAWGIVLSNIGAAASGERSFPLCFVLWLLRPPPRGEVASVDAWEPHDPRYGVFYLMAILPIALVRWLTHARDRVPRSGDLYSMRRAWPDDGFAVVEVECVLSHSVVLRKLRSFDARPRTFRMDALVLPPPGQEFDIEEFRGLAPRLIWRGDREFWSIGDPLPSRSFGFGLFASTRRYEAIELAGRNVDRLRADPHAFDEPPIN